MRQPAAASAAASAGNVFTSLFSSAPSSLTLLPCWLVGKQCLACLLLLVGMLTSLTASDVGHHVVPSPRGSHNVTTNTLQLANNHPPPSSSSSTSELHQVLPEKWSSSNIYSYEQGHSPPRTSSESKVLQLVLPQTTSKTKQSSDSPYFSHFHSSSSLDYYNGAVSDGAVGPWPWAPAPIRHWWAQHHKRSSSSSSESNPQRTKRNHVLLHQCLRHLDYMPEDSVFHYSQGSTWLRQVCQADQIDKRVSLLLESSPCHLHRVCQVLSPHDLKGIASGDVNTCLRTVEQWWKKFHNISRALVEFDKIFTTSLDIDQYSVMFDVEECKVG